MSTVGGKCWAVAFAVTTTLTGCAYGNMQEVLRSHLASEFDCASMKVDSRNRPHLREIRPELNNQYLVQGCDIVRTYTCPGGDGLTSYSSADDCTFEEGDLDSPKQVSMDGNDDAAQELE